MSKPAMVWAVALTAVLVAGPLSTQTLIAVELADEFESVCARIRIRPPDSAAIDTCWANKEWQKLIELAKARVIAKPSAYQGYALEYLTLLEIKKDRKAATVHADEVLRRLIKQPLPLARFVRHAILSDPTEADYQFARMALAPIIPDHPKNAAVRVTHLAALLGSGRVKEAVLTNKTIVADLANDLDGLLDLAYTICDSKNGRSMAITASRAIDMIIAKRGATQATTLVRFKLLHDLLDRKPDAHALATKMFAKMPASDLNDWIWDLLAKRENAGRYHTLALLASKHMAKVATLGYHEYDTMALAWFCNGHVKRAIELQTEALKLGGNRDPAYLRRMERYQAAQRARPGTGKGASKSKK